MSSYSSRGIAPDEEAFNAIMAIAKRYHTLTREEETRLAVLCEQGDQEAMDKLVTCNMRYAATKIKIYKTQENEFSDLMNAALVGMYAAAACFRPVGVRFITWSNYHIRNQLQMTAYGNCRLISLPAHVGQAMKKMTRLKDMGFDPHKMTPAEMRKALGVKKTVYNSDSIFETARAAMDSIPCSLNKPSNTTAGRHTNPDDLIVFITGSGENPWQYTAPQGESPDSCVDRMSKADAISEALECLTARERFIIERRFLDENMEDGKRKGAMTFDELGEHFFLTRERIRQIQEEALGKMRLHHGAKLAEAYGLRREPSVIEFATMKKPPRQRGG